MTTFTGFEAVYRKQKRHSLIYSKWRLSLIHPISSFCSLLFQGSERATSLLKSHRNNLFIFPTIKGQLDGRSHQVTIVFGSSSQECEWLSFACGFGFQLVFSIYYSTE